MRRIEDTDRYTGGPVVGALLDDGSRLVKDSLDAAWAEAEAALPEGWQVVALESGHDEWYATAEWMHDPFTQAPGVDMVDGIGPTKVAALRALAEQLRKAG